MKDDYENWRPNDEVDSALDAALANYAAEPRVGLEDRILANLRTVETHSADPVWWNWRIATALAVVLMIAAALAWRWSRPSHPTIVKQPSAPTSPVSTEATHHEENYGTRSKKVVRRNVQRPMQHDTVASSAKLDVFPSPLPLSEQEKILAIYVAQYPEHAALVAEARMDALRQEDEERRRIITEQSKQ